MPSASCTSRCVRVTARPRVPTSTTIHEYVGTSFKPNTVGSQATQSVSTKIKPANGGTTLYTPTMYPSGGSTPVVHRDEHRLLP